MSDSFKQSLRMKTAEQLSNMFRNKDSWTKEQYESILEEVINRGLKTSEEPVEWSDDEMAEIDLVNPKTEFEKDLSYLKKEKESYLANKGLALSSQILSIISMVIGFGLLYLYYTNVFYIGFGVAFKALFFAVGIGILSLVLFILKRYIVSAIIASISLITTLIVAINNLLEYI